MSVIDWRKYLCKTSKITCRHASNQQTRNTTWNILSTILLWSSVVFTIDWWKCLCKTSKITCRHASNQQTRNTTYRNIQYCYLLWSRKKVQLIEITLEWNDSFIIWFRDTLHFMIYIRKNNTCMTMTHINIGMSTGSDWIGKIFIVTRNGNGYL